MTIYIFDIKRLPIERSYLEREKTRSERYHWNSHFDPYTFLNRIFFSNNLRIQELFLESPEGSNFHERKIDKYEEKRAKTKLSLHLNRLKIWSRLEIFLFYHGGRWMRLRGKMLDTWVFLWSVFDVLKGYFLTVVRSEKVKRNSDVKMLRLKIK